MEYCLLEGVRMMVRIYCFWQYNSIDDDEDDDDRVSLIRLKRLHLTMN